MERKQLSQDDIWKLLEGQEDVLTPLVKKEEAFFRNKACPACDGASHLPFVNPRRPFTQGSPLPNKLLKCLHCETEFDPITGLITSVPTTPESD